LALADGRTGVAVQLYARALARARAMDSPSAIADASYNLAACLIELGNYDQARRHLAEAEAEGVRAGGNIADVLLVEATVARLQHRPNEADALADRVLAGRPAPTGFERLQAHVVKADVACDRGDVPAAEAELRAARATRSLTLPVAAQLAGAEARVLLLEKAWRDAALRFDRQAELLREVHHYRAMSEALARAGGAYRSAGSADTAADRYYRAARGLLGLGHTAEAAKLVGLAVVSARTAGSVGLQRRIEALQSEIEGAAEIGPERKPDRPPD
jgi:tetratricopeptide (TPR) repeat protein